MTALTAEIAAFAFADGDVIDTFRVRGHDNDDGEQGRDDMPRLSEGCGGQRVHVHHQMGVKRADKICIGDREQNCVAFNQRRSMERSKCLEKFSPYSVCSSVSVQRWVKMWPVACLLLSKSGPLFRPSLDMSKSSSAEESR